MSLNNIYLLSPFVERKYEFTQNSLEYLRFYLMDNGYEATMIDCAHYPKDLEEVITILGKDDKPILGITAYTRERFNAYHLIKQIRKEIPGSLIVVGGRHFGFLPEETLLELPEVDIVVRGEGEITFKEICDAATSNRDFSNILGISYVDNGQVRHNPDRPLEEDINKFRNFDKNHLPDLHKYSLLFSTKTDRKNKYFSIYATRGCPNRCVYCSLTSNKVRYRDIDSIIKEIEEKIAITGSRHVSFGDSSLTISKSFVTKLCDEIIRKKLNIHFSCYSRVNIDPELLQHMRKAGLVSVEIGLESASPKILKSIKKNINLDQFERFCKEAHGLGIKIYVFTMLSLPDETTDDVDQTLDCLRKMAKYIYFATMQVTRILPDAALCQMARERNIFPEDFNWFRPYTRDIDIASAHKSYNTLPIYRELLSERDIKEKLEEYEQLRIKHFTYSENIKEILLAGMNLSVLKNLSVQQCFRFCTKMISAYKNTRKEKYYC